jgi:Cell wall-associated hydrolases (invasion-associated proteins)
MSGKSKFLVSFIALLLFFVLSFQQAFAYSNITLKSGMNNSNVTTLQKDLKTLGFMKISPTGYFGDITKAAVIKFQKKYDLTPDGIAGIKTLAQIDKLIGKSAESTMSVKSTSVSRGDSDNIAQKVIDYAKRFLGVDYVYGGTTPEGFDCSGFVKYVYSKFGVALNRTAANQAEQGTTISKAKLLPGDLVFFDTNGGKNRINHVGIYIGGGKFIQASSGSSNVVISDITEGFYSETYMKAKRVF